MVPFPPCQKHKGPSSSIQSKNVELLEVKFHKNMEYMMTGSLWSFQSLRFVYTEFPTYVSYCLGFPIPSLALADFSYISAPVSHDSLFLPLCLSNLWGSNLSFGLRRLFDFSGFFFFPLAFYLLGQSGNFEASYTARLTYQISICVVLRE